LGSGGIGRFRDSLWAVVTGKHKLSVKTKPETISQLADANKALILSELEKF